MGAYYLHSPDARDIVLHNDLLCNGTCSVKGGCANVMGGGHNVRGGGGHNVLGGHNILGGGGHKRKRSRILNVGIENCCSIIVQYLFDMFL